MLSRPEHGWVNIKIGDFEDRASYLTNVPLDLLNAFIYALENREIATVSFDAEGWSYILVSDYYETYIIMNKDSSELIVFEDIDKFDLAKEIYDDISRDIEAWGCWNFSESSHIQDLMTLKLRLKKLKSLLDKGRWV